MGHGRAYTQQEKDFFKHYTPGHSCKETCVGFNLRFCPPITEGQAKAYMSNNRLRTGRDGRFKKGNVPANKGMPMPATGRRAETQFKKGGPPGNHKPVGTESVRRNSKKGGHYIYVKVAEPNKWRLKHVLAWEEHHGEVRAGHCVTFLDGDPLNCDIENLACVSQGINVRLNQNGLRFGDIESTKAGINLAALIEQTAKAEKRKGGRP